MNNVFYKIRISEKDQHEYGIIYQTNQIVKIHEKNIEKGYFQNVKSNCKMLKIFLHTYI